MGRIPGGYGPSIWGPVMTGIWAVAAIAIGFFCTGHAIEASRSARLRGQLATARHAADYDAGTGLPNRRRAQRELCDRLVSGSPTAVVLLDLDGFKAVNDSYGHACGDDLLAVVAIRL